MKIQCNACEAAEANVLCCADEAALCWACDREVHAANKLASKHQRVPLTAASSSQVPKCDICQEASGYFFCLEDRALFCRKCDISIHTANPYVSGHQRFLLTGVRVEPERNEPDSSGNEQPIPIPPTRSSTKRSISMSLSGEKNEATSSLMNRNGSLPASRNAFPDDTMSGSMFGWPFDDFLVTNFHQNHVFAGHESSKADSGRLGSSEGSQFCHPVDAEQDPEYESEVPDISEWNVPEIPSPPTASGLNWLRNPINFTENSVFVPDVCASSSRDAPRLRRSSSAIKHRKQS